MQVLHALWQPAGLFLWGESSEVGSAARGRHPSALAPDALGEALRRLVGDRATGDPAETVAWLPSGRRPLPSPLLEDRPRRGAPRPWRLPGLTLPAADALTVLAAPVTPAPGVAPADDLLAWGEAARWVLSLLARERVAPGPSGWVPVMDAPADVEALHRLAGRLPPSGRATDSPAPPARAVLLDFARAAVHGWAAPAEAPQRWRKPARQWLASLHAGPAAPAAFRQQVAEWLERGAPEGYRTAFRLEAPGDSWRVSFLLQALDDPSLQVEAPDVDRLPRRGALAPRERLLADLGRARAAFPELARALQEASPAGLDLTAHEAADFLRARAGVLQEMGLAVQVPAGLASGRRAVALRLRASSTSTSSEGAGGMGLANLVDYRWEVSLGGEAMDADEFRRLAELKVPLVRVRGQWVLLDAERVEKALEVLGRPRGEMGLGTVLALASGASEVPVEVRFEGDLAPLQAGEAPPATDPPPDLRAELRPYQRRGYAWLAWLAGRGLGACLADDMGLGKTVQTLARLLADRGRGPCLLVCPTSVVGNWVREAARFAPSLTVAVYHGASRELDLAADLVITTYGTARNDAGDLAAVRWRGVVLDEAQNVKNPEAGQSRAVRTLRAGWRVALTGTPVENRLTDLWSLMEFLNPGLLGTRASFHRDFVVPVQRWGETEPAERLRQAVQPFLLRRLKSDPAILPDLPEKEEIKTFCPLTREQATLYQATVQEMLVNVEGSQGVERRGKVLAALLRLKQICNHPAQFLGDGSALPGRSGKLERLEEMLEEVLAEGDRALVFSQFAEMATALAHHLRERFGREVLLLHGGVPRKERDALVERFQSEGGPPLFVLTVKAGGVGLNLTRASRVFHFDRWWNPAVENQATDRAYRIGQTRGVQVFKMICQGTLEEAIDRLIESKVALAESVVGTGEDWLAEMDDERLRELVALR